MSRIAICIDQRQGTASVMAMHSRTHSIAASILIAIQASLLAFSATRHTPTHLEPAFLAAGLSHWEFGRFELYRVNPPLVRMVAALPVLAVDHKTDWSYFFDGPGSRSEFPTGMAFVKTNGLRTIPLIFYARWACIPFSLIGAYFAYRWSSELYGRPAGLITLTLYIFEPNLLAHGELITPDAACTAFTIMAGYLYWKWLKRPDWITVVLAGSALGLVQLTKTTSLILFVLWGLLWAFWRCGNSRTSASAHNNTACRQPPFVQLLSMWTLAIYIINLSYGFDETGTRLRDFDFVSTALTAERLPDINKSRYSGNRFRGTTLGELPIPLPKQYVLGCDSQKKDLEGVHTESYLRGEWTSDGWWYYYIYGLLVKVPCGTLFLFILSIITSGLCRFDNASFRDELVLLLPAAAIVVVVSYHTAINIHLRYVFPALGLSLIAAGKVAYCFPKSRLLFLGAVLFPLFFSAFDCLTTYPGHLAYFNHFGGGTRNGYRHLLGSSLDWGQDILPIANFLNEEYPTASVIWDCENGQLGELLRHRANVDGVDSINSPRLRISVMQADRWVRGRGNPGSDCRIGGFASPIVIE